MAMDTRTKRASALGVGRPWYRTKNPNAAKPESWRQATGNFYAGNALTPSGGPVIPTLDEGMLGGGLQKLSGGLE